MIFIKIKNRKKTIKIKLIAFILNKIKSFISFKKILVLIVVNKYPGLDYTLIKILINLKFNQI